MMLRPPSSGSPTSPPSSNHNKSPPIGHPRSPPDSNPASPAPAPTPIDLNAPPPAQHTKSLLTNDAIKKRYSLSNLLKIVITKRIGVSAPNWGLCSPFSGGMALRTDKAGYTYRVIDKCVPEQKCLECNTFFLNEFNFLKTKSINYENTAKSNKN